MATTQIPSQSAASSVGLPPVARIGAGAPSSVHSPDQIGNGAVNASSQSSEGGSGQVGLIPSETGRAVGSVNGNEEGGAEENGFLCLSASCARMPVGLVVSVPVREFRVRNLLAMAPGAVIETQWGYGEDLPLSSGSVQLAWSEFEVVDTRLAVRVTRLA